MLTTTKEIVFPDCFPETPIKKIQLNNWLNIWIKDESTNPTGTHKDRMAFELLKNYRQILKANTQLTSEQLPVCSLISAGNAALAVSTLFKKYGLPRLRVLLDNSADKLCVKFLQNNHCDVFTNDIFAKSLTKEDILNLTDNPIGLDVTSYSLTDNGNQLYAGLVNSVLEREPSIIIVPYGSGILFESFCKGIIQKQVCSSRRHTYTLIGVTTSNKKSKANKLYSAYAPFDHNISRLHFLKLFSYLDAKSEIYSISEDYLDEAVQRLKDNNISAEYSGAVGLAYILEKKNFYKTSEHCVIVNTGKGILDKFLENV